MNLKSFLVSFLFATALLSAILPAGALRADDLPLAPGEVIRIFIYGRDDLSGERSLDPAGRVLVPLLGRVDAAGISPEALEARIRSALVSKGLTEDSDVLIDVLSRRDVFVTGDVQQPGAVAWRAGLTVEQAVALAGGPRSARADEFGTLLQAYSAVERHEALELAYGSLRAQEARLRAEIAFATLAFDPDAAQDKDEAATLNLAAFLPPEAATLPEADQRAEAMRILAGLDLGTFRQLQAAQRQLDLITFPDAVNADPGLTDMRATQQALIEDRIAINLTDLNALRLQHDAMREKLVTLEEQRKLIVETIDRMQEQLDKTLTLRESGLVRAADVVDLQTAMSTMLSTRLELLTEIADTEIAIQQQDLAIKGFAAALRNEATQALESVVAQLSETEARRGEARRAAALARGFRGIDPVADTAPLLRFDLRSAASATSAEAGSDSLLMPGDLVRVSVIDAF